MDGMMRRRLVSTTLFLGFGAYLFLCMGLQIVLFKQYVGGLHGIGHINLVPFSTLFTALLPEVQGYEMPVAMWLQLAVAMIPFGFCLFLWVLDCNSFRSIAAITAGFSAILCCTNYLMTAPIFNIDFIAASLFGAFIGYSGALICIELFLTKRMNLMHHTQRKHLKRIA